MEGVVAAILQRLLGRYVLGLDKSNLQVAVWSGRVVLENLSLRPDALIGLVPANLQVGRIDRLEMVVPWHKLGSLPVTVDLRGVYVLATPLNENTWGRELEEARRWSKKQTALRTRGGELRELLEALHGSLSTRDDNSISPGLMGRILDNVRLTVSGVHLRYVDRLNSSTPCALGLRLGTLQIKSIDGEGRTRFVERAQGKPVRKVSSIRNACAYLEVQPTPSSRDSAAARRASSAGASPVRPEEASAAAHAHSGAAANAAAARAADRLAQARSHCGGTARTSAGTASGSHVGSPTGSGNDSKRGPPVGVRRVTDQLIGSPAGASSCNDPPAAAAGAVSPAVDNTQARHTTMCGTTTESLDLEGAEVSPRHLLIRPVSGRLILVFDTDRHRPPGVPALMVQADFDVVAFRMNHAQYLALNDLLHYALHNQLYLSRVKHEAQRPSAPIVEAPRKWWRYAMVAIVDEWGASDARLEPQMLRQRREYIGFYRESLIADMGGPSLSRQGKLRLEVLERHSFSVRQVLAFRGLAAALAKPALLALQRKLRLEREKQQREREKRALDERRRQQERERREAERAAKSAAKEAARVAREAQRLKTRLEREERKREEDERLTMSQPITPNAFASFLAPRMTPQEARISAEEREQMKAQRRAAACIQCRWKARSACRSFLQQRRAASAIQARARRRLARVSLRRVQRSTSLVQRLWRGTAARYCDIVRDAAPPSQLLDEVVACDAMRLVLAMMSRSMRPHSTASSALPSAMASPTDNQPSPPQSQRLQPETASSQVLSDQHELSTARQSAERSAQRQAEAQREGEQLQQLLLPHVQRELPISESRPAEGTSYPVSPQIISSTSSPTVIYSPSRSTATHPSPTMHEGIVLAEPVVSTHVRDLYHRGLQANREGRTLIACELLQRAAAVSQVPSLNMLLSLANMRLKLGQPTAALLAYRYTLHVAEPNGRHAQMARRKLHEAKLIGGSESAAVRLTLGSELSESSDPTGKLISKADVANPQASDVAMIESRLRGRRSLTLERGSDAAPPLTREQSSVRLIASIASATSLSFSSKPSLSKPGAVAEHTRRARGWLRWLQERAQQDASYRSDARLAALLSPRMPDSNPQPAAALTSDVHNAADVAVEPTLGRMASAGPLPFFPFASHARGSNAAATRRDNELSPLQLELLERLLLDAFYGGTSHSRPAVVSHGGVRLQFGGTVSEVSVTLLLPHDADPSLSLLPVSAQEEHALPPTTNNRVDSRESLGGHGFFSMRLRNLMGRYQKRARGGFRLRVSAMPPDAYDLRGGSPSHTIGVVGHRIHGPMCARSVSSLPSSDACNVSDGRSVGDQPNAHPQMADIHGGAFDGATSHPAFYDMFSVKPPSVSVPSPVGSMQSAQSPTHSCASLASSALGQAPRYRHPSSADQANRQLNETMAPSPESVQAAPSPAGVMAYSPPGTSGSSSQASPPLNSTESKTPEHHHGGLLGLGRAFAEGIRGRTMALPEMQIASGKSVDVNAENGGRVSVRAQITVFTPPRKLWGGQSTAAYQSTTHVRLSLSTEGGARRAILQTKGNEGHGPLQQQQHQQKQQQQQQSPFAKRILPWRWRAKGIAREWNLEEVRAVRCMQKLIRGWLSRRGACLMRALRQLLAFSTEWLRDAHLSGRDRRTSGPGVASTTDWIVRLEKFPDGAPVLSDLSVLVPTPTEVVCDRTLVDQLLDFFHSPHLVERAAQLAYLSEVLFLKQPRRLQLALDIRTPRLVIAPSNMSTGDTHDDTVLALDMGRITFTRAAEPLMHGAVAMRDADPIVTLPTATTLQDEDRLLHLRESSVDDSADTSEQAIVYDTYEIRMHGMQALLLRCVAGHLDAQPRAVLLDKFDLALRYQKSRIPKDATIVPGLVTGDPDLPLPRHKMSLRMSRILAVKLSADEFHTVMHILSSLRKRTWSDGHTNTSPARPRSEHGGQPAMPVDAAPNVDEQNRDGTSSTDGAAHRSKSDNTVSDVCDSSSVTTQESSLRRAGSASSLLSSHLYKAATALFRTHAAHIDLQAWMVIPAISVALRFTPHGSVEDCDLLCVQLKSIRAEFTAVPDQFAWDMQLQALHIQDLTNESLPYLATSEPSFATRMAAGTTTPDIDNVASAHGEDLVKIAYLKLRRGSEPSQVRLQLHALHVEWNAPCIATLRRFFRKHPTLPRASSYGPTGHPTESHQSHHYVSSADGAASPSVEPSAADAQNDGADGPSSDQRASPVTTRVHVSMHTLRLALNQELEPGTQEGEVNDASQVHRRPGMGYESDQQAGATTTRTGPAVNTRSAMLCVLSVQGLRLDTDLHEDATLQMEGSIRRGFAHDQRNGVNASPETSNDSGVSAGGAATPRPPMISVERPPGVDDALRFQYKKLYSDFKRPLDGNVAFEGQLTVEVESPRVVWLQQWVAGAFEYLDNSVLAAVVRGVSDLSIARVWVPPNRFKPLRLQLRIVTPTVLLPRNVYALADEKLLIAHSVRVELDTVESDAVLVKSALPLVPELGALLCERLTMRFCGLRPYSQLPFLHGSASSADSGPEGVAAPSMSALSKVSADLVLTIVKSIERPHDGVPSMLLHASIEAPVAEGGHPQSRGGDEHRAVHVAPGLQLDGTVEQYELLWRIWKENIARPGRAAASALGVWGLLTRQDKVKQISVQISPVVARVWVPFDTRRVTGSFRRARGGRDRASADRQSGSNNGDGITAVLRADYFRSSVAVTLETDEVQVAMPGLAFDLYEADVVAPTGTAGSNAGIQSAASHHSQLLGGAQRTDALPLIVERWDLDFRAHERFPGGSSSPTFVSRWLHSMRPLQIGVCERRLSLLRELLSRFVNAPTDRPEGALCGRFPEPDPELRVSLRLSEFIVHLHSSLGTNGRRRQGAGVPPVAEFLRIQVKPASLSFHCKQSPNQAEVPAQQASPPLHQSLMQRSDLSSPVPLPIPNDDPLLHSHSMATALEVGELQVVSTLDADAAVRIASLEKAGMLQSSGLSDGVQSTQQARSASEYRRSEELGTIGDASARYLENVINGAEACETSSCALCLFIRTSRTPTHRHIDELTAAIGKVTLQIEPHVATALFLHLRPIRADVEVLTALFGSFGVRALHPDSLFGVGMYTEQTPHTVTAANVSIFGTHLSVELALVRSGQLVRALADLLLGVYVGDRNLRRFELWLPPLTLSEGIGRPEMTLSVDALRRAISWHYGQCAARKLFSIVALAMLRSWRLYLSSFVVLMVLLTALVAQKLLR